MNQHLTIAHIPAVLYGPPSERVWLFVHGQSGYKEEASAFADLAVPLGWQVLGIDLPGHGERKGEADRFVPWEVVPELQLVWSHLTASYTQVALRANSIGAWFSMMALADTPPVRSLFVSPLLDMEQLIESMMRQAGISEEQLAREKTIPSPSGQVLSWAYLQFVRAHPVRRWPAPTAILYGSADIMTPRPTVDTFAQRFSAELTVMEGGEHWFHTPEQLSVLTAWERKNMC